MGLPDARLVISLSLGVISVALFSDGRLKLGRCEGLEEELPFQSFNKKMLSHPVTPARANVYGMFKDTDQKPGWWKLYWLQVFGCILTALSIAVMAALAWLGAVMQPTGSQVALLTLVGASFQLVSAWVFSRVRRVDLIHAGASVRRLLRLALRAEAATDNAERARSKDVSTTDIRGAINQLSVELSVLQEGLVEAAQDWTDALPELLSQQHKTPTKKDSE